jgi:hypothetical protein
MPEVISRKEAKERTCVICLKMFATLHSRQKTCCLECRYENQSRLRAIWNAERPEYQFDYESTRVRMPNNKLMKNCTGAEMAKLGSRFIRIAEKVGKDRLVGAMLTEDQFKELIK